MHTPKSFKPYHGCFGRFQGRLDISANFNPGEWTEVVGKKGTLGTKVPYVVNKMPYVVSFFLDNIGYHAI